MSKIVGVPKYKIPNETRKRLRTREQVDKINATRLFVWIKDELDPTGFTLQEILEDGWEGLEVTYSAGFNREVEIPKLLSALCSQGLIGKKEEGEGYEITEKGLETQEPSKGDISEMVVSTRQ